MSERREAVHNICSESEVSWPVASLYMPSMAALAVKT